METFLIQTKRLNLRPFTVSDAADYFEMVSDNQIKTYINNCPHFWFFHKTVKKIKDYSTCNFKDNFYLVIENRSTQQLIGALLVEKSFDNNFFNVTMMIHKDHRKNGYMSESLQAFINFLPSKSRLYFIVFRSNHASVRTIRKIPGIQKEYSLLRGLDEMESFYLFTYLKP